MILLVGLINIHHTQRRCPKLVKGDIEYVTISKRDKGYVDVHRVHCLIIKKWFLWNPPNELFVEKSIEKPLKELFIPKSYLLFVKIMEQVRALTKPK